MTRRSKMEGGPGWHRMKDRLGARRMEEMRQAVLHEQKEALGRARPTPTVKQGRDSYHNYPSPHGRQR